MADMARGRTQIVAVVGATGALMLLISLAAWLRGAAFQPVSQLGRPAVLAFLGWLAYRGVRWARTALVLWLAFIAITFAVAAVLIISDSPVWGVLALLFAAGLVGGVVVLYTSDDVNAVVGADLDRRSTSRPAT